MAHRWQPLMSAAGILLLVGTAVVRGDALPPKKLAAEPLVGNSAWDIDGDHAIVDGVLILGGERKTRAVLRVPIERGFDLRWQCRTEGKGSAEVGWDLRRGNTIIPGVGLRMLAATGDWEDAFLQEYVDWTRPTQRMIRHPVGANGVFDPIESIWIDVPAGTKLHLRNVRMKNAETVALPWLLAIPLAGIIIFVLWRWRKKRQNVARQPAADAKPDAS